MPTCGGARTPFSGGPTANRFEIVPAERTHPSRGLRGARVLSSKRPRLFFCREDISMVRQLGQVCVENTKQTVTGVSLFRVGGRYETTNIFARKARDTVKPPVTGTETLR
jgi:hypothetical protein